MKNSKLAKSIMALVAIAALSTTTYAQVSEETLKSIQTPDKVETSIGTLEFIDGAPLPETAQKVYDHLDTMRGVDAFMKGVPGASLNAIIDGVASLGAVQAHQVVIYDKLGDSKSLYLTMNSSTMYILPTLDLKRDGPTVLEAPAGMLGLADDAWFRFLENIGPLGPDKGKGGKYLFLPPGYDGEVPDGYFVVRSPSYRVWMLIRTSVADGLEVVSKRVKSGMRIYPLAKKDNPPAMEWISGTGREYNTIHANDFKFYDELNAIIQYEHLAFLDKETRGLFASIGIEKGKPFNPDARMKKILTDAVAIANATARSILWYPRTDGTMKGIEVYPGDNSAWLTVYLDKNVFFDGKDHMTMNTDARLHFHYPYTGVSPAMAVTIPGKGSDYGLAYVDADKNPFDGSKNYKLHLPPNPPVNDFWSVTIYDSQTRSMLQTSQPSAGLDSVSDKVKPNADGSIDIYIGPKAPKGMVSNWVESVPGKSFFFALRMFGPLEPWINKSWRPSEIELIKY